MIVMAEPVVPEKVARHRPPLKTPKPAPAGLGTFDVDHATGDCRWSPPLQDIVGFDHEPNVSWEMFWKLLHPEDRSAVLAAILHSLEPGGPRCFSIEHRIVRPDGTVRWLHAAARTTFTGDDDLCHPQHTFGTVADITERKREDLRLRETDRRKNEFLALLGHELRNPLAAIRNAVLVLADAPRDADIVEWATSLIDRQSQQLTRLVGDLVDFSRAPRSAIPLRKEIVSLRAILRDAVQVVLPAMKLRDQHLFISLPEDPLHVLADADRLQQVFVNLLTNASRYGRDGGSVTVHASRNGEIRATIADNGLGIAPEMMARMFEPFVRGNGNADRDGGVGLGLAVVKSLVEMHGGTITARSAGLGKGSQMIVALPLCNDRPIDRPHLSPLSIEPATVSRRIIIVDDHADSRCALERLLTRVGHRVGLAENGESALALVHVFPADVMLLDLGLPDIDGWSVARQLRADGFDRLKLIAVSGQIDDKSEERCYAAGIDSCLAKPVDMNALNALLRQDARTDI